MWENATVTVPKRRGRVVGRGRQHRKISAQPFLLGSGRFATISTMEHGAVCSIIWGGGDTWGDTWGIRNTHGNTYLYNCPRLLRLSY